MSYATTLNVRGQKLHTATRRRYVVVAIRTEPRLVDGSMFEPFVRIHKRTDNINTARTLRRRYGWSRYGNFALIIDTTTGEEVT